MVHFCAARGALSLFPFASHNPEPRDEGNARAGGETQPASRALIHRWHVIGIGPPDAGVKQVHTHMGGLRSSHLYKRVLRRREMIGADAQR